MGFRREIVYEMLVDQDGLCAYCDRVLRDDYTVDHIVPRSQGGSDEWDNLAIVCFRCNGEKGTRSLVDYMNARGSILITAEPF